MVTINKNNEIKSEILERIHNIAPIDSYNKSMIDDMLRLGKVYAQGGVLSNPLKEININHRMDWGFRSRSRTESRNENFKHTEQEHREFSWFGIFEEVMCNVEFAICMAVFCLIIRYLCPNRTFTALYFIVISAIFMVVLSNVKELIKEDVTTGGCKNQESDILKMMNSLWDLASKDLSDYDEKSSEEEVPMEKIEPQSLSMNLEVVAQSLLFLLSLGIGYHPKNGALQGIKEFLKQTDVSRTNMMSAIINAYTRIGDLLNAFENTKFLAEYFELPVEDEQCRDWINDVHIFVDSVSTSNHKGYEDNTIQYKSLITRYDIIIKRLGRNLGVNSLALKKAHDMLEDCRTAFERRFKSLRGFRPEPVMVFFHGPAGVMKSTLCDQLATLINNLTIPDEAKKDYELHPSEYTYRRSVDKWWEGYTSKANVVVFDDLFQLVDNGSNPSESEASLIIRMINSEEFAVPMAQADSKNSTFFRSNFVLASSNVNNMNLANSIHSKEALSRRLHFKVEVGINDIYKTNGKIDYGKLDVMTDYDGNPIPGATIIDPSIWTFKVSEVNGNGDGPIVEMSYIDLVEAIVRRYYRQQTYYEVNRATALMVQQRLDEKVRQRLSKDTRSLHALRTTLRTPIVPQSGFNTPGNYKKSDVPEQINQVETMLEAMSHDKVKFVYEAWNTAILQVDRSIYCWNDHSIVYRFIKSLTNEDLETFLEILVELDEAEMLPCVGICNSRLVPFFHEIMLERKDLDISVIDSEDYAYFELDTSYTHKFVKNLKHCVGYVMDNITYIAGGLTVLGIGIYYIAKSFSYFVSPQSGDTDRYMMRGPNRGNRKGDNNSSRNQLRRMNVTTTGTSTSDINPHGIKDYDALWKTNDISFDFGTRSALNDVLRNVMDKHFFIMWLIDENNNPPTKHSLGHAINVQGRSMLTFAHSIYVLEDRLVGKNRDKIYIRFNTPSNNRKFAVYVQDFLDSAVIDDKSLNNDYAIFNCGNEPASRGCLKFFVSEKDVSWQRRNKIPVSISGFHQTGKNYDSVIFRTHATEAKLITDKIQVKKDWDFDGPDKYYLTDVLEYRGQFANGDCGSLINIHNPSRGIEVLLGFHIAGSNSVGYSNIVYREDIDRLLSIEPTNQAVIFKDEIEPQGLRRDLKLVSPDDDSKVLHGKFDNAHSVANCMRSEIKKSELFGKLPAPYNKVTTYPARLGPFQHDGVTIDPKEVALSNYGRALAPINTKALSAATVDYYDLISRNSTLALEERITLDTVTAIESFGEHVKKIKADTSPGWPMNTSSNENIKEIYFKALAEGDSVKADEYLTKICDLVEEAESLLKNGTRPVFIYSDALKDETRPVEKVREGKTRMFSGCPFILLILFRKYFGMFQDEFFHMNIDVGSAIGVNPYSEDWHLLARKLLFFGDKDFKNIGAGDYSKFDCSEQPEVLQQILWIINLWYNDSENDNNIRTLLWYEITHSRHIFYNEYYEWCNGMPSGNPMTAIINTMYNQIAFRVAWSETPSYKNGLVGMSDFSKFIYVCALGDDNIFAVHPDYMEEFNEITLTQYMEKIGLTYTTETKGTATQPFRLITEVDFLKRGFKPYRFNGLLRWTAPIRIETITEMLNWTKRGYLSDQITVNNINTALREFSLHGNAVYDYWRPRLMALRDKCYPGLFPDGGELTDWKRTLMEVLNTEHYLG